MRPLHLLMALYVFGLSLMTCTDGMAKDDCGDAIHFHQAAQEDDHAEDACSPFCICTCCSGAIEAKVAFTFSVHLSVDELFTFPAPWRTSADGPAIWQPPKLG